MDRLHEFCNAIVILDTETSGLSFTHDEITRVCHLAEK